MNTFNETPITHDHVIARARKHLANFPIGEEFSWAQLFGEEWAEVSQHLRPQTVGDRLTRHFSQGPNPVVQYVRTNRSPRYSVFVKLRGVDREG